METDELESLWPCPYTDVSGTRDASLAASRLVRRQEWDQLAGHLSHAFFDPIPYILGALVALRSADDVRHLLSICPDDLSFAFECDYYKYHIGAMDPSCRELFFSEVAKGPLSTGLFAGSPLLNQDLDREAAEYALKHLKLHTLNPEAAVAALFERANYRDTECPWTGMAKDLIDCFHFWAPSAPTAALMLAVGCRRTSFLLDAVHAGADLSDTDTATEAMYRCFATSLRIPAHSALSDATASRGSAASGGGGHEEGDDGDVCLSTVTAEDVAFALVRAGLDPYTALEGLGDQYEAAIAARPAIAELRRTRWTQGDYLDPFCGWDRRNDVVKALSMFAMRDDVRHAVAEAAAAVGGGRAVAGEGVAAHSTAASRSLRDPRPTSFELHLSIRERDLEWLSALIAAGVDLDSRFVGAHPIEAALMTAGFIRKASRREMWTADIPEEDVLYDVIYALVDGGADVDAVTVRTDHASLSAPGWPPRTRARFTFNANIPRSMSWLALMYGRVYVVRQLLVCGASVGGCAAERDAFAAACLHTSCPTSFLKDVFGGMRGDAGGCVGDMSALRGTPSRALLAACRYGRWRAAEVLLNAGAEVPGSMWVCFLSLWTETSWLVVKALIMRDGLDAFRSCCSTKGGRAVLCEVIRWAMCDGADEKFIVRVCELAVQCAVADTAATASGDVRASGHATDGTVTEVVHSPPVGGRLSPDLQAAVTVGVALAAFEGGVPMLTKFLGECDRAGVSLPILELLCSAVASGVCGSVEMLAARLSPVGRGRVPTPSQHSIATSLSSDSVGEYVGVNVRVPVSTLAQWTLGLKLPADVMDACASLTLLELALLSDHSDTTVPLLVQRLGARCDGVWGARVVAIALAQRAPLPVVQLLLQRGASPWGDWRGRGCMQLAVDGLCGLNLLSRRHGGCIPDAWQDIRLDTHTRDAREGGANRRGRLVGVNRALAEDRVEGEEAQGGEAVDGDAQRARWGGVVTDGEADAASAAAAADAAAAVRQFEASLVALLQHRELHKTDRVSCDKHAGGDGQENEDHRGRGGPGVGGGDHAAGALSGGGGSALNECCDVDGAFLAASRWLRIGVVAVLLVSLGLAPYSVQCCAVVLAQALDGGTVGDTETGFLCECVGMLASEGSLSSFEVGSELPLRRAARRGHSVAVAEALLDAGADVNGVSGCAVELGTADVVSGPSSRVALPRTAFEEAALVRDVRMCRFLVRRGASVSAMALSSPGWDGSSFMLAMYLRAGGPPVVSHVVEYLRGAYRSAGRSCDTQSFLVEGDRKGMGWEAASPAAAGLAVSEAAWVDRELFNIYLSAKPSGLSSAIVREMLSFVSCVCGCAESPPASHLSFLPSSDDTIYPLTPAQSSFSTKERKREQQCKRNCLVSNRVCSVQCPATHAAMFRRFHRAREWWLTQLIFDGYEEVAVECVRKAIPFNRPAASQLTPQSACGVAPLQPQNERESGSGSLAQPRGLSGSLPEQLQQLHCLIGPCWALRSEVSQTRRTSEDAARSPPENSDILNTGEGEGGSIHLSGEDTADSIPLEVFAEGRGEGGCLQQLLTYMHAFRSPQLVAALCDIVTQFMPPTDAADGEPLGTPVGTHVGLNEVLASTLRELLPVEMSYVLTRLSYRDEPRLPLEREGYIAILENYHTFSTTRSCEVDREMTLTLLKAGAAVMNAQLEAYHSRAAVRVCLSADWGRRCDGDTLYDFFIDELKHPSGDVGWAYEMLLRPGLRSVQYLVDTHLSQELWKSSFSFSFDALATYRVLMVDSWEKERTARAGVGAGGSEAQTQSGGFRRCTGYTEIFDALYSGDVSAARAALERIGRRECDDKRLLWFVAILAAGGNAAALEDWLSSFAPSSHSPFSDIQFALLEGVTSRAIWDLIIGYVPLNRLFEMEYVYKLPPEVLAIVLDYHHKSHHSRPRYPTVARLLRSAWRYPSGEWWSTVASVVGRGVVQRYLVLQLMHDLYSVKRPGFAERLVFRSAQLCRFYREVLGSHKFTLAIRGCGAHEENTPLLSTDTPTFIDPFQLARGWVVLGVVAAMLAGDVGLLDLALKGGVTGDGEGAAIVRCGDAVIQQAGGGAGGWVLALITQRVEMRCGGSLVACLEKWGVVGPCELWFERGGAERPGEQVYRTIRNVLRTLHSVF